MPKTNFSSEILSTKKKEEKQQLSSNPHTKDFFLKGHILNTHHIVRLTYQFAHQVVNDKWTDFCCTAVQNASSAEWKKNEGRVKKQEQFSFAMAFIWASWKSSTSLIYCQILWSTKKAFSVLMETSCLHQYAHTRALCDWKFDRTWLLLEVFQI